jgi:hypothetical protein
MSIEKTEVHAENYSDCRQSDKLNWDEVIYRTGVLISKSLKMHVLIFVYKIPFLQKSG